MFDNKPSWYTHPMFEWTIMHLPEENILLLTSKGQMDVPSANAMVKALAEAASEYRCELHLLDHRGTVFLFDLSDYFARPSINENLGISRKFRTAMVLSEITEDTRFMENVFRNRGYNLRHFTDFEQAKEWLQGG